MKTPAQMYQMYTPSHRPYNGLPDVRYPLHDREVVVTACGGICMYRKRINPLTRACRSARRHQGGREGIWIVSFMHYDLGYIDLEQKIGVPSRPSHCTSLLRAILAPSEQVFN